MGWTNPNIQQVQPISNQGSFTTPGIVASVTAASPYQAINMVDVSYYASYDINVYGYAPVNAAGAPVVALVRLLWYDDLVTGIPVFEENYWIWSGRGNATVPDVMTGTGPMHGHYMSVYVAVSSSALSAFNLQYINIFGSPRPQSFADWRQNAIAANPQTSGIGINQGTTNGYDNVVVSVSNLNLGANAITWIPFNLYVGPVYYRYQTSGAAPAQNVIIAVADNIVSGTIVAGTGVPTVLVNITNDTVEHEGTFIAPRAPCYMTWHGNATTASSLSLAVIGQQAA